MAKRFPTCNGEKVPMVELAFHKDRCIRRGHAPVLRSPAEVAAWLSDIFGCKPQEHFVSVFMNGQNEVLGVQEVAVGGLSATPVDPRVVFAGALLSGAAAIILAHNHPSGGHEPSQQDIQLTRQLTDAGKMLGIHILDHLIIARGGGWSSLREKTPQMFAGEGYGP